MFGECFGWIPDLFRLPTVAWGFSGRDHWIIQTVPTLHDKMYEFASKEQDMLSEVGISNLIYESDMHKLQGFDGCQWLPDPQHYIYFVFSCKLRQMRRCRQALDKYRCHWFQLSFSQKWLWYAWYATLSPSLKTSLLTVAASTLEALKRPITLRRHFFNCIPWKNHYEACKKPLADRLRLQMPGQKSGNPNVKW